MLCLDCCAAPPRCVLLDSSRQLTALELDRCSCLRCPRTALVVICTPGEVLSSQEVAGDPRTSGMADSWDCCRAATASSQWWGDGLSVYATSASEGDIAGCTRPWLRAPGMLRKERVRSARAALLSAHCVSALPTPSTRLPHKLNGGVDGCRHSLKQNTRVIQYKKYKSKKK